MPRTSKSNKQRSGLEFWQGGKLPESVVRRNLAKISRARASEIAERVGTARKTARYLSQLQTPAKPAKGATADKALSGLRSITERLSKTKRASKKLVRPPIWPWGSYTLTFTPPDYVLDLGSYIDGEISSVTGDPTISATGDETLGQMTCTVETNYNSPSAGTASNLLGVYFKPHFLNATVTVSFESEISFYWYVNSIRNKEAISEAQGLIELYQYDGAFVEPPLRVGAYLGWAEVGLNSLDFDVVSEPGPTWSLQAPVSSNYFYFVVVRLSCTASGSGWPGSLAGAVATVTVPSITVNVTGNPVVLNE